MINLLICPSCCLPHPSRSDCLSIKDTACTVSCQSGGGPTAVHRIAVVYYHRQKNGTGRLGRCADTSWMPTTLRTSDCGCALHLYRASQTTRHSTARLTHSEIFLAQVKHPSGIQQCQVCLKSRPVHGSDRFVTWRSWNTMQSFKRRSRRNAAGMISSSSNSMPSMVNSSASL